MMYNIYADEKRIFQDSWNGALGNKILHLLYIINLANNHKRNPIMYKGSNLDTIFNFKFETVELNSIDKTDYYYKEKDPFYFHNSILWALRLKNIIRPRNLKTVYNGHFNNCQVAQQLLSSPLPKKDIKVGGLFFDHCLMPDKEVFSNYIEIKSNLEDLVKQKYPSILNDNSVAVHYRGTDFENHLRHFFPKGIVLNTEYYQNAVNKIESLLGKDVEYHLFSDNLDQIEKIFKNKKCIIHQDSANIDWVAIFLSKNIIQSNSSFCWTASLFNKSISIQPLGGYNLGGKFGPIPYGFYHPESTIISAYN